MCFRIVGGVVRIIPAMKFTKSHQPSLLASVLMLALLPNTLAGCVTGSSGTTQPGVTDTAPAGANFEQSAAAKELSVARRMIYAGQYSQVIPRLLNVINRYPETLSGKQARYWTGFAYYGIAGMRDARDNFEEYLRVAPEGEFADSARSYLAKLTNPDESGLNAPEDLVEEVRAARRLVQENPEEMAHKLQLADALWKHGQYEEAGDLYAIMLQEAPKLAEDAIVRNRIERAPDGSVIVLTPAEMQRREARREPLVIFNTQSYKSGREAGYSDSLRKKIYNVTGQIVNRSSDPMKDVAVVVTIYGFGSTVYDSQTFRIGTMNPKETRAFSVPFTRFDNIENVYRFDCVASYTR